MTLEWPSPTGSAVDRAAAEAVRVEVGLERAADEQRRAVEGLGLLRCVDDRGHERARVCPRRLVGRNLGRSGGFRVVQHRPRRRSPRFRAGPPHVQTPDRHPPDAARGLPGGGVRVELAVDDVRGAARAARSLHARPHARRRSGTSGSTACACSCTGGTTRPPRARGGARTSTRPTRTPTRPARGRAWTGCSTPRRRAGSRVQLTLTGPVPRWATKGKRDNVTQPEHEGVPGLRHRRRPPLRRPRSACGRSGTSPTTRSSCSRSS